MHLLEETVLYNSMNKNHYYKERTEIWLARLHIKRFSILREKGCPSRHCKRNRIKQADSLEILHHVRKCSRHLEKVSYRTKIFKPYQFNILNVYKVNNFHRVEKSVLYDYLEEKSWFFGSPAIGKTHLSINIGLKVMWAGYTLYFERMTTLIKLLKMVDILRKTGFRVNRVLKSDLIITNETGYTPIERKGTNLFFNLISELYEKASVIITSK